MAQAQEGGEVQKRTSLYTHNISEADRISSFFALKPLFISLPSLGDDLPYPMMKICRGLLV